MNTTIDITVGKVYLPKIDYEGRAVIAWYQDRTTPGLLLEVMHKLEADSWNYTHRVEHHWAKFLIGEQAFWLLKPELKQSWTYYLHEVTK